MTTYNDLTLLRYKVEGGQAMSARPSFDVGDELVGPGARDHAAAHRVVRQRDAVRGHQRAAPGRRRTSTPTSEFARSEGFATANADGMIMTNWCSEMLLRAFGIDYLERGELRTKYIKPVNLGVELHVRGRIGFAPFAARRSPAPGRPW